MGDEYTETVDTSSDMDTSEDFSEDVPEDSSFDSDDMADDIPEDIPEDVPEDSSFDSDDMPDDIPEDIPEDVPEDSSSDSDDIADDIPEDIPEDVPEDSSTDSDDIADDIPEDIPEDVPEDSSTDSDDIADDIPEDIPEDVPEDSSTDSDDMTDDILEDIPEDVPADTQNDVANETSSDETEDSDSDVSADEQPIDTQDDMAEEVPSDETEDTASDVSADEQPADTQDDMAEEVPSGETEDTASDVSADEQSVDTQDDMAEEVPSDETEDTASDVSADEQPADTQDDMAEEVPSDETEDTASDVSADEQPADTQDDMAEEVPSDETEDTASDVSADEQPADTQDDMAEKVPSDETEDTASDVSADEQSVDTQDDMAEEVPSDETEDTASDVSADEQSVDTQDDMAEEVPSDETEDTASDVSADEQPADTQDDMAEEVLSDETEDFASDISADEQPDTQNDIERNADTQEDAFLQLSDYMNEHNYGPDDFAIYSQDPEWQRLHSNAYPDYTPPETSSADTQENSFRQLSEYMNEHNYGPDDFAIYSQDPEWQRLHSNAYPDYTPPETSSADTQENSFRQLSEYMNEHNYGPDDFAIYSQDPEWQRLHSNAYPDYTPPETSSADTQENSFRQLSEYMNEHNYGPDDFAIYSQDPEWQRLHSNAYPDYTPPETSSADTQENSFRQLSEYMNEHNYGPDDFAIYSQDPEWQRLHSNAYPDHVLPEDSSKGNDIANESPTMEDEANDTNWNPFKPKKETKNAYNWNKNEWEATPVVRDMPSKSNTDSKEYSSMVDALEKANVEYRPIQLAEQGRTEEDIINRLSGGDMTKGSCSSLALAYIGNKAGYDVLDFRDGDSRLFFSSRNSIQKVADMPGIKSTVLQGTNDIATANQLLSGIQAGKEYYLATGGHAAIVKRVGNGYQYLELQHPSNGNGWHNLNDKILRQRFGCKDSRPYECSSYLIDVDSLANSSEFRNLLGYINTASSSQKKGVYGNVR